MLQKPQPDRRHTATQGNAFLIEQARQTARAQHKTLNQAFREWLEFYARSESDLVGEYDELMKRLNYVKGGRKFSREEMNALLDLASDGISTLIAKQKAALGVQQ